MAGRSRKKYICDGSDLSPPLIWTGLPAVTKIIAVIAVDPDAPMEGAVITEGELMGRYERQYIHVLLDDEVQHPLR